ncbi:hypothetical protein MJH12_06800 [bacterium]|nr:hypothetical protein [bacterium]
MLKISLMITLLFCLNSSGFTEGPSKNGAVPLENDFIDSDSVFYKSLDVKLDNQGPSMDGISQVVEEEEQVSSEPTRKDLLDRISKLENQLSRVLKALNHNPKSDSSSDSLNETMVLQSLEYYVKELYNDFWDDLPNKSSNIKQTFSGCRLVENILRPDLQCYIDYSYATHTNAYGYSAGTGIKEKYSVFIGKENYKLFKSLDLNTEVKKITSKFTDTNKRQAWYK